MPQNQLDRRSPQILPLIRSELIRVVGRDQVSIDDDLLQKEAMDWSWAAQFARYRGDHIAAADVAVWPSSTDEVSAILRVANDYRIPVIIRGGGSGTLGGTFAPYGGIAVNLSRMDRVLDVDETSMTLTVEAGADGLALEEKLNARGLTLPHYPGSMLHGATVGGYVAARGSGVVSTKYGKAEDLVLRVKVVMPNGKVVQTLPVPNHATGPDLLQVFVGSEGTLGAITEVTFRIERLPQVRRFVTFTFGSTLDGIEAARRIMIARLRPAAMRLYDPADAAKLGQVIGEKIEGAVMIVVCDGDDARCDAEAEAIERVGIDAGAVNLGPALAEQWWNNKYKPFAAGHAPEPPTIFGTTDSCTTFARLPELYLAKKQAIEEGFAHLGARYTAHFSHWYPWGGMIYDRFYVDNGPADPDEALILHDQMWDAAVRTSLEHGGVVNEHHGIGMKLGRFMRDQYGDAFDLIVALKEAWDPHEIMNPGKLGFGPPR